MAKLLGTVVKQPDEVLDYDLDFTKWFEGRTVTPGVPTAVSSDPELTIVDVVLFVTVVKVIVSGGVDGKTYKVTVKLPTSAIGEVTLLKEVDFNVKIKAI